MTTERRAIIDASIPQKFPLDSAHGGADKG